MKELIPVNQFGIFVDTKETIRIDSVSVAKALGKRHSHVLEDIERITQPKSRLSEKEENFMKTNFKRGFYKDVTGRKLKCYYLTEEGFSWLIFSYQGETAREFKIAYIEHFTEMKRHLKVLQSAKTNFPYLTERIKILYNNPEPWVYAAECDMLNRVVLGLTAAQYKARIGKEKANTIRPFLSTQQIILINELQAADIGLLLAIPDITERERLLRKYKADIENGNIKLLV